MKKIISLVMMVIMLTASLTTTSFAVPGSDANISQRNYFTLHSNISHVERRI